MNNWINSEDVVPLVGQLIVHRWDMKEMPRIGWVKCIEYRRDGSVWRVECCAGKSVLLWCYAKDWDGTYE